MIGEPCWTCFEKCPAAGIGIRHVNPKLVSPSYNRPPLDHLLELLPRLQARYYSISSSPRQDAGVISITAVVIKYKSRIGREVKGVATNYLADKLSNKHSLVSGNVAQAESMSFGIISCADSLDKCVCINSFVPIQTLVRFSTGCLYSCANLSCDCRTSPPRLSS